jgi:PQQ enzyme repeat
MRVVSGAWRHGPVIASPLYAGSVNIGGRLDDVVYATTQDGSVYALDAVDGRLRRVLDGRDRPDAERALRDRGDRSALRPRSGDGGSGDFATGRLVAVDVGSVSIVATVQVVPGAGNLGGIWGFGGASIDPLTGDLWTATGLLGVRQGVRLHRPDDRVRGVGGRA